MGKASLKLSAAIIQIEPLGGNSEVEWAEGNLQIVQRFRLLSC